VFFFKEKAREEEGCSAKYSIEINAILGYNFLMRIGRDTIVLVPLCTLWRIFCCYVFASAEFTFVYEGILI